MEKCIYIERTCIWRPAAENPAESPKLPYVDALFKRRLSQASRMTIEVVHGVLGGGAGSAPREDIPLVFASLRGEVGRQLKINRGLVEAADVSPAQFSLSTFNTPPAVATIALGLRAGYTAVYPVRFPGALAAAAAPVLSGKAPRVAFVYADEKIPAEYAVAAQNAIAADAAGFADEPLAFAAVLSRTPADGARELARTDFATPAEFARFLGGGAD